MGKKPCILGNNCPNKIAKKNFSNLLSDQDSELYHNNLKENCVFCGSYTIKTKRKSDTSSVWSSSSNESSRMKRPIVTEIDSLCGMRSSSKRKKEDDIDDNFDYLLKKVLKGTGSSLKKDDDDDEELSDSGVKMDYDSPSCSGVNVKKNNEINSFKSQSTGFKFTSPIEVSQRNGYIKDTFKLSAQSNFNISKTGNNTTFSSPDTPQDKESPLMSGNNSSASDFSPVRKRPNIFRISSPVSEASSYDSPFKKNDSVESDDPFEFDSDHEFSKHKKPVPAPKEKDTSEENVPKIPIKPLELWSKDKNSDSDDDDEIKPTSSFKLWSKGKILDSDDEQETPASSFQLWSKDKVSESNDEQKKPISSLHLWSKDDYNSERENKSQIQSSNLFSKDKDLVSNIKDEPTKSGNLYTTDRDFEAAGPSSRPDIIFDEDNQEPQPSSRHNARFINLSYLPRHKVERLLYKAIKFGFNNECSSSSDEDDIWISKEVKKDRKRKRSRQSAPVKDKMFKSSQKIGSGFYRWKKRRRTHNALSDEDSNLTFDSTNDASDVDDDSDSLSEIDNNSNIQNNTSNYQDHDYSTSEFNKIAEANIDSLAFETEKLNWDDTVMIDDATMDSAIITLDDSPQRFELPLLEPAEGIITLDETDTSNTTKSKSPDKSPNLDNSDHIYCVTEIKLENPNVMNNLKQSEIIKLDDDRSISGSDKTEEYDVNCPATSSSTNPSSKTQENSSSRKSIQWECPICLESSTGQEISATICGHIFCKDCIESYLVTSSQCPTCRKELDKKLLITLYDMMK